MESQKTLQCILTLPLSQPEGRGRGQTLMLASREHPQPSAQRLCVTATK